MALYRKKPVVVEAVQWWPGKEVVGVQYTWDAAPAGGHEGEPYPVVHTLEGIMLVTPGDWIITGVRGEHYPCKPDIFTLTYEAVSDQVVTKW